ncbi:flagellar assembly protein FliW [Bacillus coahuilensis p1.1.43]|uniref:Flagellar assembly factor FliW n=1 Tax=Bacillus coahuilensis p1.1.43 TaxID=1150625 RepID=A0A147K4R4_9BACI|nr:flagellar assembly protein FliW [Bacillus coahuilensis]KUP04464.1 flagellar assembly protein FliW [Bacillus coahuilensis p1.1.43]
MNIHTKYHGEIQVKHEDIIDFELGIPGFPEERQFLLLPLPDNHQFAILQSVLTPEIGFVVTTPYSFFPNYEFILDDSSKEHLELEGENNIQVFVILTIQEPFTKSTANLQAPVVLNGTKHKGKQVILNIPHYHTKHALFTSVAEKG